VIGVVLSFWIVDTLGPGHIYTDALAANSGHIAIVFRQVDTVKYLTWDGSGWQRDSFVVPELSREPSLALDTSGAPYMGARHSDSILIYIRKDSMGWVCDTPPTATDLVGGDEGGRVPVAVCDSGVYLAGLCKRYIPGGSYGPSLIGFYFNGSDWRIIEIDQGYENYYECLWVASVSEAHCGVQSYQSYKGLNVSCDFWVYASWHDYYYYGPAYAKFYWENGESLKGLKGGTVWKGPRSIWWSYYDDDGHLIIERKLYNDTIVLGKLGPRDADFLDTNTVVLAYYKDKLIKVGVYDWSGWFVEEVDSMAGSGGRGPSVIVDSDQIFVAYRNTLGEICVAHKEYTRVEEGPPAQGPSTMPTIMREGQPICLSGETAFVLYDASGRPVRQGMGQTVPTVGLGAGVYFLKTRESISRIVMIK